MQQGEFVSLEDVARLTAEVERVKAQVERLTGLTSRWSGHVHVVDTDAFLGTKEWSCAISLNRVIMESDDRYAILLH